VRTYATRPPSSGRQLRKVLGIEQNGLCQCGARARHFVDDGMIVSLSCPRCATRARRATARRARSRVSRGPATLIRLAEICPVCLQPLAALTCAACVDLTLRRAGVDDCAALLARTPKARAERLRAIGLGPFGPH
jgi:hypothetical protein